MKYLFSFLLVFLFTHTQAREKDSIAHKHVWAIKGKMLPWIALGTGINFTLGGEYGFGKVHSIGMDLVYNEYSFEHEVYDSAKKQYASGPRLHTVSRGVFINYRRYVNPQNTWVERPLNRVFKADYLPYVSLFVRYGKYDLHYETGYVTNQISYDEWQYSGGFLLGVVTSVFDINFGPFYKRSYVSDRQLGRMNDINLYSTIQSNFGVRLGVNLLLVVKRNSGHYLETYKKWY